MFRVLVALMVIAACGHPSLGQERIPRSPKPLIVRNVSYRTSVVLPAADRNETSRLLRQNVNDTSGTARITDADRLQEIGMEYARALLADHGYWQARIEVKLIRLPSTEVVQPVDVMFDVDNGPQFSISNIAWTGMKEFTEEDLQRAMPIHGGDIASRSKVARGLEELRKLYASRGYINFTVVPSNKLDNESNTIDLLFDIDEGAQFRFGELSLPGLDDAHRQLVVQKWASIQGTVYSPEKERDFFQSVMRPAYRWWRKDVNYSFYSQFVHRQIDEKAQTFNFSIRFIPPRDVH